MSVNGMDATSNGEPMEAMVGGARRASGILIHPTSFPSRFGVGDLGPGALRVLDYLAAAKQRRWQVLPLVPPGYGESPYAALSAFAGNPLLISPEALRDDGLLGDDDLANVPDFPRDHVDYAAVAPWKDELLRKAYVTYQRTQPDELRREFGAFCEAQASWLEDYALFQALKVANDLRAWVEWPQPLASHDAVAVVAARAQYADEIDLVRFTQFLFFRQWQRVREAAHARGIAVIGDVAIFVAEDSADVWAHREYFTLDEAGHPSIVAGVPPDYFSPTGQRWGNPLYRWDVLAADGYGWWVERVRQALSLVDVLRLDHFRGFEAYWEIPASEPTAEHGRWVKGPGAALFNTLTERLGNVHLIAEDLGLITPEVRALMREIGLPGMHVLHFAFGSGADNENLPHHYTRPSVVYTGTHDNDTTHGWFEHEGEHVRQHALAYLSTSPDDIVWAMIRAAEASVCDLAILPLQDVLELGSEARMNLPSRLGGNWGWRCTEEQLTDERAARLASLTELYGR